MRRKLLMLFFFIVLSVTSVLATPPVSIKLAYDLANRNLHVVAVHPSFNLEKSYVRLMYVYVNGNQVSMLNYFKQDDYNEFNDTVPVAAQVGDVIKVDLFCTLGGEMAQEMTVTKPGAQPPDQGTDASSDNSATDSSH